MWGTIPQFAWPEWVSALGLTYNAWHELLLQSYPKLSPEAATAPRFSSSSLSFPCYPSIYKSIHPSFYLSACLQRAVEIVQREREEWSGSGGTMFFSSAVGSETFKELLDGDTYKFYSNGEWQVSTSGKSIGVLNPTTLKLQFKVQGLWASITHLPIISLPMHDSQHFPQTFFNTWFSLILFWLSSNSWGFSLQLTCQIGLDTHKSFQVLF